MSADEVRALLHQQVNGNQAAWAKAHDLSPAYVSDVLNGRREPGRGVLRALGLHRVISFERQESA